MASMNSRAKEVIAELDQFEADMNLTNKWVHGDENMTVLLGGVSTPSIRNLVKNFRLSAQEILNAAEYIQDNFEGLEDIIDANREYAEIAGLLMLKIADWMARDLAEFNAINISRYNDWLKHGIERLGDAGRAAQQCVLNIHEQIDRFDVGYAQKRLQERLLDGTTPTSSSKPVLFLIAGQSNAVGSGDRNQADYAGDCGQFYDWFTASPGLKPICDPMARDWMTFSAWPSFARRFWALTNRQLVLINVANGGAGVADYGNQATNSWADNEYAELRPRAEGIWADFSQIMAPGSYDVGGIIWYQGETDGSAIYLNMIDVAQYIAATLDVFSWARNLIGDASAHVFVCKTCYSGDYMTIPALKAAQEQIQVAQDEICQEENVHMAFSMTPRFADAWSVYMRPDGAHCNSYGYSIIGKGVARCAAHVLGL